MVLPPGIKGDSKMGTEITVALVKLAVFAILFGTVMAIGVSQLDMEAFDIVTNIESIY